MSQVVDGDLVKVMSWYDNEWGYSSQLVREALRIAKEREQRNIEEHETSPALRLPSRKHIEERRTMDKLAQRNAEHERGSC